MHQERGEQLFYDKPSFHWKRNERMQEKRLKRIQKTPQTKDAKKLRHTKRNPAHNSKNLWVIDKSPWEESKKFSNSWLKQTKWNKNCHFSSLVKDNRISHISVMVWYCSTLMTISSINSNDFVFWITLKAYIKGENYPD